MLTRNNRIQIKATPGFLLLLGVLFYLDDGSGIVGYGCAAAVIHELGHVLTCVAMGGRVEALQLSLVGAELKLTYPKTISYGRENLVLLSGAMLNLITGIIALNFSGYWLALLSFALGGFNLLPIVPLDGGRILYNLLEAPLGPTVADQIMRIVSGVFIGVLLGIGCIVAVKQANIMLLGLSAWLLAGTAKKKHKNSPNK